jgi:sugar phosphate isomerase/epimerase
MWNKNVTDLDASEVERSRQILEKYKLRVTDIASPLYKVNWPGAPQSKEGPPRDQFHADFDFNEKLRQAARTCAKHNLILVLENEMACNTGSGKEAAATMQAVTEPNFMLNWDPGNSATFAGDVPYPDDYNSLPKHRIGHCHCKDTIRKPGSPAEWAPVGGGIIDWVGQFKAFVRDGYHYAVSLETHWHGGVPDPGSGMGVPEASTRISMKGLKEALGKAGVAC